MYSTLVTFLANDITPHHHWQHTLPANHSQECSDTQPNLVTAFEGTDKIQHYESTRRISHQKNVTAAFTHTDTHTHPFREIPKKDSWHFQLCSPLWKLLPVRMEVTPKVDMFESQRGHNCLHQFSSLTSNYFHLPVVIGITHTILERKRKRGGRGKRRREGGRGWICGYSRTRVIIPPHIPRLENDALWWAAFQCGYEGCGEFCEIWKRERDRERKRQRDRDKERKRERKTLTTGCKWPD